LTVQDNLLTAAINLLEARSLRMITEAEWEALAQAIEEQTGQRIEWRTTDELTFE
jgi:hypothetical protein